MNKKHNRFRSHMPREQLDQLQGTEIKSKRTRFGKVFALGANRFQAVTYTDPVHRFNEKTCEWDEMDNRFSATPRMKEAKAAWKQGIMPAVAHSDVLLECKTGSMDVACAMSGEVPFINLTDAEGRHLAWGIKDAMSILPEADDINDTPAQNVRGMREKVLDHLHGEVAYNGIFAGVDLRCKLDRGFKDELIFAEKESVRPITFLLESEGRQMELNEQNMLIVKDEQGEAVFRLQAPFMLDANEQRGEVVVQLEALQGGMYAMTYILDAAFIASAVFPVTLDPAVETDRTGSSIEDTYVREGYDEDYSEEDLLWVSDNTTYDLRYSYLRVADAALPKIGSNHFITGAELYLYGRRPDAETRVMCAEITDEEPWAASTVRFSNKPDHNPLYQDYCTFPAGVYSWQSLDVTSLARKWYLGDNKGIVLLPQTTSNNTVRMSSSDGSSKPYLVVNYASLAGLESYLSYDNQPVGHAGTGSVSLANGNLIFAHADTSMNGNLMPVSVTHFYNSCDADKNEFALGYGWRTSMHQTLHMERINSENMYVYTDGDGTEHWFELDEEDSTQYVDMSGLSLTLKVGTDNKITISDKGNNYMVFDAITAPTDAAPVTAKKLICELHDAVGNKVVVTAVSTSYPLLIKKITDGANRETIFDYNSAYTQCTAIRTPWQTDPTKACTRFAYDNNGDLEFIYHEDERRSEYDYKVFDGFHLLEVAHAQTAEDDTTKAVKDLATVTYTYSNAAQDEAGNNTIVYGLPYCITAAVVKGFKGDTELKAQDVTYTYGNHLTLVTDNLSDPDETKRKTLRFHFNDNGNRVSVDDELGYALYTGYDQDGENADAPINHATVRSRMQRLVKNLLVDPMFDANDSAWVKSSTGVSRDASTFKFGQVSTKLAASASGSYIQQTVALTPDSDYTFSGYIRSSAEKAFLRVTYTVNGVVTTIDSDPVQMHADPVGKPYERTAVSFHLPAGATSATCAAMCIGSSGYAWASCMQLEEGLTCNHFNMIQNCDFTRQTSGSVIPKKWTLGANDASYVSLRDLSEVDAIDNLMAPGFLQNAYAIRLAGRYDRTITLYQEFRCEGSIGDRFTAGGWCKSFAKKMSEENSVYCRIDVQFTAAGSNAASAVWLSGGSVHFNYEEGNWQFASGSIVAPSNYVRIRFILHMGRQMNHTDFTGLYLYPEAFGTEYVYDKKGNRKLAVKMYKYDKTQRADSYEYDDCDNLIKKTAPGRAKSSVFYYGDTEDMQKKHQLLRAVAPEGAVSTYEYDAENGNLTASQIQNAESNPSYFIFIRTETTYTADGNYVATQTDARGKVVTTVTDPDKGTVTSVTDPKGQTVAYTYDELRRVTHVNSSVQVNAEAGSRSYCNEYTYDEDTGLLSTVSHNTTSNDCDVTYSFGYDALGRKTTVNVGNVELSRNEYQDNASQPHYGTLKKMTYGNGNTVENTYDDFNRVTAVHYNGEETPRYEYAYNAKGQVAHVTHNTTDDSGAAVKVVTESEYDLSDRPIRVKEHEGSKHVYSGELAYNDEFGVLSEFREKVGESRAEFVTTLSYDDQNRPIAMGYGSYGGSTTTIDKLNRMTYSSVNLGGDPFTSEYHFATGGHGTGSLTGLVTSITQSGGNCSYGYDDNGNIANATVNGKWTGYVYDALGQLIRVNDRSDTRSGSSGSVWTYEYDQGGNILSKKRYPYAEPTADNVLETTTFTYGNPNWKDQLTAVNGVPIS
ncbi:MAG: RHS repeat protein, partial [Oscillospiraceae bacterium]|nr:RHS repeat protein [Oscillospiraceae bacterium]